jgi:hypothetical protein
MPDVVDKREDAAVAGFWAWHGVLLEKRYTVAIAIETAIETGFKAFEYSAALDNARLNDESMLGLVVILSKKYIYQSDVSKNALLGTYQKNRAYFGLLLHSGTPLQIR